MFSVGLKNVCPFSDFLMKKRKEGKNFPIRVVRETIVGLSLQECLHFMVVSWSLKFRMYFSEKCVPKLYFRYQLEGNGKKSWAVFGGWTTTYRILLLNGHFGLAGDSKRFRCTLLTLIGVIEYLRNQHIQIKTFLNTERKYMPIINQVIFLKIQIFSNQMNETCCVGGRHNSQILNHNI